MQYSVVSRKSGTLRLLIVGDILSGMPVGVIVIITMVGVWDNLP